MLIRMGEACRKLTELIAFVFISSLCCGSKRIVGGFVRVMFCSKFGKVINFLLSPVACDHTK